MTSPNQKEIGFQSTIWKKIVTEIDRLSSKTQSLDEISQRDAIGFMLNKLCHTVRREVADLIKLPNADEYLDPDSGYEWGNISEEEWHSRMRQLKKDSGFTTALETAKEKRANEFEKRLLEEMTVIAAGNISDEQMTSDLGSDKMKEMFKNFVQNRDLVASCIGKVLNNVSSSKI